MTNPLAYPLSWPAGWARTKRRQGARYGKWSVARACEELLGELGRDPIRCAPRAIAVSTNVAVRLDGLPYSNQRAPDDPGAAVYFPMGGRPTVLACDRWDRVEHNLRALSLHVAALRALDRHGVGTLEQAFLGYAALPEHAGGRAWWEVLELDDPRGAVPEITLEEVESAFREAARYWHPDLPNGDGARFREIVEARKQAREALGVSA